MVRVTRGRKRPRRKSLSVRLSCSSLCCTAASRTSFPAGFGAPHSLALFILLVLQRTRSVITPYKEPVPPEGVSTSPLPCIHGSEGKGRKTQDFHPLGLSWRFGKRSTLHQSPSDQGPSRPSRQIDKCGKSSDCSDSNACQIVRLHHHRFSWGSVGSQTPGVVETSPRVFY